jgi:hypothetical protein
VLREVGWKAIGELEAQIKLIKRVLQLEIVGPDPETPLVYSEQRAVDAVPTPNNEQIQTPEELDEELGANDFETGQGQGDKERLFPFPFSPFPLLSLPLLIKISKES